MDKSSEKVMELIKKEKERFKEFLEILEKIDEGDKNAVQIEYKFSTS